VGYHPPIKRAYPKRNRVPLTPPPLPQQERSVMCYLGVEEEEPAAEVVMADRGRGRGRGGARRGDQWQPPAVAVCDSVNHRLVGNPKRKV
jgi:hypothetical protein